LDRSEIDPRLAAAHCGLEVLSKPAVAVNQAKVRSTTQRGGNTVKTYQGVRKVVKRAY
jgi:hypothetical protein